MNSVPPSCCVKAFSASERRAGSVKMWLKPNVALRGRGLHRSLHAVIGTWVLPIYLAMTLTGLLYSFDWYKSGVTWLLSRPDTAAATMAPKPARSARASETGTKVNNDVVDAQHKVKRSVRNAADRTNNNR